MNKIQMNFEQICPYVRFIDYFQSEKGFFTGPRKNYDHQFIYIHKGEGNVVIDGITYDATDGDLFYYKPGVVHSIYSCSDNPCMVSGMHFDFTMDHCNEYDMPVCFIDKEIFNEALLYEEIVFYNFEDFLPKMNFKCDYRIKELILLMRKEFENKKIHSASILSGYLKIFLTEVARHINTPHELYKDHLLIIDNVIKYIHDNYSSDLTNKEIAARFHFDANYLNHMMVTCTGIPLKQYIINYRIKKAMELLINTDMPINEISEKVGISNIYYFSRLIKNKTGKCPSLFRSNQNAAC